VGRGAGRKIVVSVMVAARLHRIPDKFDANKNHNKINIPIKSNSYAGRVRFRWGFSQVSAVRFEVFQIPHRSSPDRSSGEKPLGANPHPLAGKPAYGPPVI
jgi:hypothetical protein